MQSRRSSRLTPLKKNKNLTPSRATDPVKPPSRTKAEEQGELSLSSLRRSSRGTAAENSGKSEKSLNATDSRSKSGKRKRSEEELPIKVNNDDVNGKYCSNAAKKKRLNAQSYRALFKHEEKELKTSDTCSGRGYSDDSLGSGVNEGGCLRDRDDTDTVNEDFIKDLGEDTTGNDERRGLESEMKEVAIEETSKQDKTEMSDSAPNHVCAADLCKYTGLKNAAHAGFNADQVADLSSKDPCLVNAISGAPACAKTCNLTPKRDGSPMLVCGTSSPVEASMKCPETQRASDLSPMNFHSNSNPFKEDAEPFNQPLEAETDNSRNTCIICKLPGKLLCCLGKGCRTGCHPSCTDSTLKDLHPGGWYCPSCVRKKIVAGVYTVSDGVESIWDVREVDVRNGEDLVKQKQYFVKYKGLAHVHNFWMAESQMLDGNPELVAKFIQQEEAVHWKPEWTIPDRLLQKRSIKIPKSDEEVSQESDINSHEWLVKWRGLDYSHVTWEIENASFLRTSHALELIKEYEIRHGKSRKKAPIENEMQAKKKGSSTKLPKLHTAIESSLNVNNLCDYWRKRQNLVVIDEQDQTARTVHLISYVQPDVSRPFLIITPSGLLSKWEAEFLQSATSINVVVYGGNKDAREIMRTVEFYGEDNCVMFQVLLSSHDAAAEDMDSLKCIKWEAIVVDQCHNSLILANSSFVKQLDTDWTLLLMNEINENVADYCNVLSLLNLDDSPPESCSTTELKERLSPFIIQECKSNVLRFVEYWVPAEVSNVQLEQYCSSLLSDSVFLCSKNDPLNNLPKNLLRARECCDHPYIVNPNLQSSLIQGQYEGLLDIGIRASGKLQLLDDILSKVKCEGLRVLVLFQAVGGAGRSPLGDILDDIVRQKYGPDSYERIDRCEIPTRKRTALNKFNSHESRFIFLLDTHACSPIIKLQSVDCVIIFNSDWNPLSDLKALQKIKIDTKKEQINIFRLYASCTIEEKVLILSKNGLALDSTMQTVNWYTGHKLLMWGASYLFKKLDEFHDSDASSRIGSILRTDLIFKNVHEELLSLLQKQNGTVEYKFISKATMKGGVYSRDVSLAGEQIIDLEDEELPSFFWEKLLKGRQPRWRYLPVLSSQRSRKRIQMSESLPMLKFQIDESSKKPKLDGSVNMVSRRSKVGAEAGKQASPGTSGGVARLSIRPANDSSAISSGKQRLLEEQKCLHQDLRPMMSKLFEILGLKEETKVMAERFLKYVINNHRVTREPESILHAFEISVCWVAASLLGENIDKKHSLILAREHLNFSCDDNEADYILSKMRSLSELFIHRSGDLKGLRSPRDPSSGTKCLTREAVSRYGFMSDLFSQQKITDTIKEQMLLQTSSVSEGVSTEKDVRRNNTIHKKCPEILESLIQRQLKEAQELKKLWQEKKAKLERNHNLDSAVIQSIHPTFAVRIEKLKIVNEDYARKCEELDSEMATSLKELEARHQCEKVCKEVDTVSSLSVEFSPVVLDKIPSADAGVTKKTLQVVEENETQVSDYPGNFQVNQITVGDPSSTPGVQGDPPEIVDSDSLKQVVESCELPAVPVDKNAFLPDNNGAFNYLPKCRSSNEVIPANEATLDNVEVVHPKSDSHELNIGPSSEASFEVVRHDEDGPVLQGSSGNHINEELAKSQHDANIFSNQMAAPGRYEGATTFGDRSANGQLLTPRFTPQSHANASEANPMVTDKCHAGASISAMINQVNVEMMSSRQNCVNESGDIQGTVEEPGVSYDESVQPVPSSVVPDERSHSSFPSSSEPQHQLALDNSLETGVSCRRAVPTSVAPCSQASFLSSSEAHHQATHNPLTPFTLELPNQSGNLTVADLPRLRLPHHLATRSLLPASEVRGHAHPVGLPFLPESAVLPDPLQNVLDKIQKQMDQSRMNYMEARSKLIVDRDKEIEDIVAQIRKKYEVKVQEAEASYLQQDQEYVGMLAIVHMNKKLAEEFRSKCIDFRAAQAGSSPVIHRQQHHHFSSSRVSPALLFASAHSYRLPTATRAADHIQAHAFPAADIHSRQHTRPPHISPHATYSGQQHHSVSATSHQYFGSGPAPMPRRSVPVQPLNNSNSAKPSTTMPLLSEIARHFDSWNLSGFDTLEPQQHQQLASGPACRSTDAPTVEQQPQQHVTASQPDAAILDIVCLCDDE